MRGVQTVQEVVSEMARGGSRNRSGPQPDPESGVSDRRGLVFTALPADGYRGTVPEFPLTEVSEREAQVWAQSWRTPQAAAWAVEGWRWRTVALWVRWSVRMEDPAASATLGTVVVRLADQVGMTPAGLRENGWKISAGQASTSEVKPPPRRRGSVRDRLKVVPDDET